jgi:predicted Fe-S protein YdhL (DUF1289 family)
MSQRASEFAQALCSDAHLYGGHPCLGCQQAAHELVEWSSEEDPEAVAVGRVGWVTRVEAPSHGTSLKTSESRWARVLSGIRRDARLAAQEGEPAADCD